MVNLNEQSLPKPILNTVLDILIRLIDNEGGIYPNTWVPVSHVLLIIAIVCVGINIICIY